MNRFKIFSFFISLFVMSCLYAQTKESAPPSPALFAEDQSSTEGQLTLKNEKIPYQATTGIYQFKDEEGNLKARFFYIAYTRSDTANKISRPLAFCFNGGPGASSVWMHLGLLGPKRVALNESAAYMPPYHYIDNEYSLLDAVDLVFIDPISTGYSRVVPGEDAKKYHSVDEDVKSIAEFIRLYTTRNGRWESPKFLIGASYGTLRAVKLTSYLLDQFNMTINGAILVSSALNFQCLEAEPGSNELPFVLYLPSYTAIAWYHRKLSPALQASLHDALEQAKSFARNEYALALFLGDNLSDEHRQEIIEQLSFYTGVPPSVIESVNLRMTPRQFMVDLLKQENKILGRFDARLTGISINRNPAHMDYDPSIDAIFSAFTATFNQYVREELKWSKDDEYRVLANVTPWNYGKDANQYYTVIPTLREMLIRIPSLSLFVASGYFDLATPFYSAEYNFNHLNVKGILDNRLTMKYYPAGHMMYTDLPSLRLLSRDLHSFIQNAY